MTDLTTLDRQALALRLTEATLKLQNARAVVAEASEKCSEIYQQWYEFREEYDRRNLQESDDITYILDPTDETKVRFDAYWNLMQEHGLVPGGVWDNTNQRIVQISLKREDCERNTKQINALRKFLPHIKPLRKLDESDKIIEGCKPVGILDRTHGEFGVYCACVRPDGTVVLSHSAWGRTSYQEIGDFDTAMKYIQQHHWYDSDYRESSEEDDYNY